LRVDRFTLRLFLLGLVALAAWTAVVVVLAAALLDAPAKDLLQMAVFMTVSGAISVVAGAAFILLYRGPSPEGLRGLRGKLLAAVLLASGLILVNVAFTANLMFLSTHDLNLLGLLMLFSLGVAAAFALLVARVFDNTLQTLLTGVRLMGEGKLETRVRVDSGDELQQLAEAFNVMAQRLEEAFGRQRDLEEARRNLVAAVSHDLRTPLATMRAMVESINDGVVTDAATIERYHRTMQTEIAHLSRLIDDLFELSQIDSGTLELKPESSSIGDLVSDTLEALRPQAEQRRLKLQGELNGRLPAVSMDVPRMQRVLYNLVQNALRHTPPDGTVIIRAVDAGSEIEISVADTGEGVDAEELARVFERFYRGSRARSRQEAGSGLGLTIAKGIVELHGGRIWADSRLGQGSIFVFTIPKPACVAPNL
jgi:two-component system, OmpR family, sensor histidine kinase SaeS